MTSSQLNWYSLALGAHLLTGLAGQHSLPVGDSVESNLPQAEWERLYGREQGITEPSLISPVYSLQNECKGRKLDGSVRFSLIVDRNGNPRNVVFERALASELDRLALKLILNSKFRPAMLNGSAVAVGQSVEMRLQVCTEERADQSGKISGALRLRYPPEEKFQDWKSPQVQANLAPIEMPPGVHAELGKVGGHFTPPKKLILPHLPDAKGRSGSFSFLVRVDEHGIPQIQETLKSTDQLLLPAVIRCIRDIRHQPALNDGMPVPALVTLGLDLKSDTP